MCQFCVEHGEGKKWYLQASNYAFDLESDLKRREYMVHFVKEFDTSRAMAISGMEVLGRLPGPLERLGKSAFGKRMRPIHFGQPVPIEECEQIFDITTSIVSVPCVCRRFAGTTPEEVCLLVTTQPVDPVLEEGFRDYADGPETSDFGRLTKAEAMVLLRQCEERGLMHSVWTFLTPFIGAICNCNLESGCMAMKLTRGYSAPLMWRGEWVARLEEQSCTACGSCVRVCPFGALSSNGTAGARRVTLDERACWGCGICRYACGSGALSLADRASVPAVAGLW
jgi:ferredoxin